jgi:hypothetical protein
MKKCAVVLLCLGIFFFGSLLSCDNGDTTLPYGITIEDVEYDTAGTYDFGLTEAENGSKTVTLTLTNTGEADLTVTNVELSDLTNYSLTTPELPLTAAPEASVEPSVTFNPQASGDMPATISITVEGLTDPFVLNLSGEGNYAPSIKFGIQVAGAGTADANGFYEKDGSHTCVIPDVSIETRALYTKTGSSNYYCYIYYNGVHVPFAWCLDDSMNADSGNPPEYEYVGPDYNLMVPPAGGWTIGTGDDGPPTVTRYDITGLKGYTTEDLTANYLYSDIDGDAENSGGVTFQWYRSATENGTYTAISGATAKVYTPPDPGHVDHYLKVEITPAADTGITSGAPIMSSPTIMITQT